MNSSPDVNLPQTLGLFPWHIFASARFAQSSTADPLTRLIAKVEAATARYRMPTFGAQVAGPAALDAILRYGNLPDYEAFVDPQSLRATSEVLGRVLASRDDRAPHVVVQPFAALTCRSRKRNFRSWFSPSPDTLAALCYLRQLCCSQLFPITVLHYTISYQSLLPGFVLPTLLANSYRCDSIFCSTRAARISLQHLFDHVGSEINGVFGQKLEYKGRLDVVPHGVNTDRFRPREKPAARSKLHLPKDALIILYLGRLSPSDKMDLFPLVRVFSDLAKDKRRVKLLLILAGGRSIPNSCYGTPIYLEALKNYARELGVWGKLRILLSPQDPELLYSAADIFVSPCDNMQESFGIAVIEAMASGLPQVVADWNGYRDTVEHGKTGFLVPTYWADCDSDVCDASPLFLGDPEIDHATLGQSVAMDIRKFKNYLADLIDNEDLRQAMSRNSRKRALALYDWAVIVGQYEVLWNELAQCAEKIDFQAKRGPNYMRPAYVKCFAHYASALLGEEARLWLTCEGRSAASRAINLIPKGHIAKEYGLLNNDLLRQILITVTQNPTQTGLGFGGDWPSTDNGFITLQNLICQNLADCRAEERSSFLRHVLWLIKYGFLEVSEGER